MDIPQLANPLVLLLISPIVLAGWYAIRKGIPKALIISRMVILSLLIIALASPFTLGTSTVRDEAPRITVVSDQTMSMDLFNKDTGSKIFESIKSKTPTTYRQFAGISSPIGDELINNAEGNNNIVLVSDGDNNYGKDMFDAISFVSKTGTRVFAVKQKPIRNDAGVEIESAKNLIIGNENVFNIVVRQAGNETSYKLDVEIDGKPVKSENVVQKERTKVIPVSAIFNSLGTHKVTATITPSGEDWFPINNKFYKAVFVVPKPKVLAVTEDTGSPLYTIASSLYQVTTLSSVPDDLSAYKTVIIDNKGAGLLSAESLRKYVGNGGGLVVVGGDASYDKGNYNNSPVEAILPIISRAAEYRGGNNIVIVIDTSGSTSIGSGPGVAITYPDINANARHIVDKIEPGGHIGVVAFGGTVGKIDMRSIITSTDRDSLEKEIEKFYPGAGLNPTNLGDALIAAKEMLDSVSGTKSIVVISDGFIDHGEGFTQAPQIEKQNIQIRFIQVIACVETPDTPCIGKAREPFEEYEKLAKSVGTNVETLLIGERLKISTEEPAKTPTPTPTPEISYEYPLAAVNTEHFITKYLNLTASVTGYNEATPKLGSDRLVATTKGKPILTTWGFGLGRVISFTTDNGDGLTMWSPAVYSGDNSRLISAMINWAIGDPRPREGVVIQAEDIWGGTPGRVVVTSNTIPQVKLDGTALDLSRTGPTTYEASINLEKEGFHDLSGYGIAVNYPLEYREVGFNEKLIAVIAANGGRVYSEDEVEGLLLLDIKEKAIRTVQEPKSQKEPFLLAALGLFLAEVIVRRIKDYRKERPVIEDNPPRVAPAVEAEVAG